MTRYCATIEKFENTLPEKWSKDHKSIVAVCEIAACTFIVTSLKDSNYNIKCFSYLLDKWCTIMLTLMKSNIISDRNILFIKNMIYKFIMMASTSDHLYVLCEVLIIKVSKHIFKLLYTYFVFKLIREIEHFFILFIIYNV